MGLSFDTKFDLGRIATLPFDDNWFAVPPRPKFGQRPRLGMILPETVVRLKARLQRRKN